MTMMERAAQAAREEVGAWRSHDGSWMIAGGKVDSEYWLNIVRAIIEEIREPDQDITHAGVAGIDAVEGDCATDDGVTGAWHAMIDAILASAPPKN